MADVTGGTPPTGSSPFDVPGDLAEAYEHFGDASNFSVANAVSLPASGNWEGRILETADTGTLWVRVGSTWVPFGGKANTGTVGSLSTNTVTDLELSCIGNRITIEGRIYKSGGATFATNELVGVIPTGFRPAKTEVFLASPVFTSGSTWAVAPTYITSDGNMRVNLNGIANAQIVGLNGQWRRA